MKVLSIVGAPLEFIKAWPKTQALTSAAATRVVSFLWSIK
jgi:hypothetical protein